MKNIALGIVNTILGVLTLMIVMSVYGRMNRSMELASSFPSALEETVEHLMINRKYNIHNTNEFLADLVQTLSVSLETESDLTVEILQCDKEKGILSVRAEASYLHPNGKPGTVTCERTVILNRIPEEVPENYRAVFYVGEELYKEYTIQEENTINAPVSPQTAEEMVFYGWIDANGNAVDFTQPVTQDIICHADIR